MRKLLILLSCLLLYGCNPKCILSQIPNHDMALYADKSCKAVLPDYFKIFIPVGCNLQWQIQDPPAGFVLTENNPLARVTLTIGAQDTHTNTISFNAFYVDTIRPLFKIDSALLIKNWMTVDMLYNAADKMLFSMLKESSIVLPINTTYIPYIPMEYGWSYAQGMNLISYNGDIIRVDTTVFYTKNLVIRKSINNKRSFSFE